MFNNFKLRGGTVLAALVALPLCLTGCAVDDTAGDPEVQAEAQDLGLSCKVFRPLTWVGFAATCREAGSSSLLILPDGATLSTVSAPGPGLGMGSTTIKCVNGKVQTIESLCSPGRGE